MPDSIYLASVYRLTAVNFWNSAEIISTSIETKSNCTTKKLTHIPFYFLVSHAAELLLKSALLKRGFPVDHLKKFDYRHNLNKLLEALQRQGVLVTLDTEHMISDLHSQHQNHALRYTALVDDGQKTYMLPPSLVFSMLEELLLLTKTNRESQTELCPEY